VTKGLIHHIDEKLDLARHRVVDDIAARAFQGLTAAIPHAKLSLVQDAPRQCIDELRAELSCDAKADSVIRVQMVAYLLTRKS